MDLSPKHGPKASRPTRDDSRNDESFHYEVSSVMVYISVRYAGSQKIKQQLFKLDGKESGF